MAAGLEGQHGKPIAEACWLVGLCDADMELKSSPMSRGASGCQSGGGGGMLPWILGCQDFFASMGQQEPSRVSNVFPDSDTVAEWLGRRPAEPMGSPRVG
jgi:hypothetical protein